MAVVVFDPAQFKIVYPQFAAVADAVLENCFNGACNILNNTDTSPVQNIPRRTYLLYLLTAHIATLEGVAGSSGPAPVGRLSQASEGTVSVSFDYNSGPNQAWFAQTQYGALFWQATTNLRGFRYVPRAQFIR